jgi:hypothetical protein
LFKAIVAGAGSSGAGTVSAVAVFFATGVYFLKSSMECSKLPGCHNDSLPSHKKRVCLVAFHSKDFHKGRSDNCQLISQSSLDPNSLFKGKVNINRELTIKDQH